MRISSINSIISFKASQPLKPPTKSGDVVKIEVTSKVTKPSEDTTEKKSNINYLA